MSKRPRQSDEISSKTIVVYSIDPEVSSCIYASQ